MARKDHLEDMGNKVARILALLEGVDGVPDSGVVGKLDSQEKRVSRIERILCWCAGVAGVGTSGGVAWWKIFN